MSRPTDFDFNDQARRRQPRPNVLAEFFSRALANFLGTLLAGLILLLIVRAYLRWSFEPTRDDSRTPPSVVLPNLPPIDFGKGRK